MHDVISSCATASTIPIYKSEDFGVCVIVLDEYVDIAFMRWTQRPKYEPFPGYFYALLVLVNKNSHKWNLFYVL